MSAPSATFSPSSTLAELATTLPGASRVFARHRLDFCCGGSVSLEQACRKQGLDVDTILAELGAELPSESEVRWDLRPLPDLIDHILAAYHERHRAELPRLIGLAAKVEGAHQERPDAPRGLREHLERLAEELESHMQKEEQILFPLLRAGRGAMAQAPIQVMEMEHDAHAENLRRTRRLTADLTPPGDACPTWQALYLGLEELEEELMRHVHLENHVLFPRAVAK